MSIDTFERVKEVVIQQLSVEDEDVTENTSFTQDLGADSLDELELLIAFQGEFGLEISDEEAEKIKTVKDAVDYIKTHQK